MCRKQQEQPPPQKKSEFSDGEIEEPCLELLEAGHGKRGVQLHTCNPSIWEEEAGGPRAHHHHSTVETILGYRRPDLTSHALKKRDSALEDG